MREEIIGSGNEIVPHHARCCKGLRNKIHRGGSEVKLKDWVGGLGVKCVKITLKLTEIGKVSRKRGPKRSFFSKIFSENFFHFSHHLYKSQT